jgi:ribonuclease-3
MVTVAHLIVEAARRDFGLLERALGYRFKDPELLRLALTHKSFGSSNNERLEFIGDRKLNSAIADELFERFPHESEGQLAKRINMLVQRTTCAAVAQSIGLSQLMRLSDNEKRGGGHDKTTILADAIEAVIGAIFIDSKGNYRTVRKVVAKLWDKYIHSAPTADMRDYKTELQELTQGRIGRPTYTAHQTGSQHEPMFTATCHLGRDKSDGSGRTRKAAEQAAAAAMLRILRGRHAR